LDFGDPDQSSQSAHDFYALAGTWIADLAIALMPPPIQGPSLYANVHFMRALQFPPHPGATDYTHNMTLSYFAPANMPGKLSSRDFLE